jgi:hypothetical protein
MKQKIHLGAVSGCTPQHPVNSGALEMARLQNSWDKRGNVRQHENQQTSTINVFFFALLLYLSLSLWLCSSLDPGRFFSFLILYTVGRTPWTGDQPVVRPLPIYRIAQRQNKRTQTSMPRAGFESTTAVFERVKTIHVLDRAATLMGSINECKTKTRLRIKYCRLNSKTNNIFIIQFSSLLSVYRVNSYKANYRHRTM